jgi:ribosomal protein S18 acetylase RimI-like enzyme
MNIKDLTNIPIEILTEAFNESFADYILKFQATPEYLDNRWKSAGMDRQLSVGCFEKDRLVGFMIHGFSPEKNEVYNAATGIIPEFRGQRLVGQMYDFLFPLLRERGIAKASLEVIQENIKAVKAYRKVGFEIGRSLASFKGKPDLPVLDEQFEIVRIEGKPDWELYTSFWEQEPSWEMSIEAIERIRDLVVIYESHYRKRCIGYLVIHPGNGLMMQMAIDPSFRKRKVAMQLLSKFPANKEIKVVNIDYDASGSIKFYQNLGLENYVNQYEMIMDIMD